MLAAPISIGANNNKPCSAYFVLTREAIESALPAIRTETVDNMWRGHVYTQALSATVNAQVVVHQSDIALKDVMGMSVGDFVPIEDPYTGILEADSKALFTVSVGKTNNHAAVTIEDFIQE